MNNKIELPPLMSALETYIDTASENRVDDLINLAKKKKKKIKKQKPTLVRSDSFPAPNIVAHVVHSPEGFKRPDSRKDSRYNQSPRAVKLSKLPVEENIAIEKSRDYFGSYSVSSPTSNISPKKKALQHMKASVNEYVRNQTEPSGSIAKKTGFNKAVESIAALKLHNYAMKRRDHMAQKLKLLREIRGIQKESNGEFRVAVNNRKDEIIAAWKIRYFIELCRLKNLEKIAKITVEKSNKAEDEREKMRQALDKALQESQTILATHNDRIDDLNAELNRATENSENKENELMNQIYDINTEVDTLNSTIAAKDEVIAEKDVVIAKKNEEILEKEKQILLKEELLSKKNDTLVLKDELLAKAVNEKKQEEKQRLEEFSRIEMLRNELNITRKTCQEVVRINAEKEAELEDLKKSMVKEKEEHKVLIAALHHKITEKHEELNKKDTFIAKKQQEIDLKNKEIVVINEQHVENIENLRLKNTEENETKSKIYEENCFKLESQLSEKNALINEKEDAIESLKESLTELSKTNIYLIENEAKAQRDLEETKLENDATQKDMASLQKLVTEFAVKSTKFDEETEEFKKYVIDTDNKMKKMKKALKDNLIRVNELENNHVTAAEEIDLLADENEELARELECHAMYSEELEEKNRIAIESASYSNTYSRYLEEQLFLARKLEKNIFGVGNTASFVDNNFVDNNGIANNESMTSSDLNHLLAAGSFADGSSDSLLKQLFLASHLNMNSNMNINVSHDTNNGTLSTSVVVGKSSSEEVNENNHKSSYDSSNDNERKHTVNSDNKRKKKSSASSTKERSPSPSKKGKSRKSRKSNTSMYSSNSIMALNESTSEMLRIGFEEEEEGDDDDEKYENNASPSAVPFSSLLSQQNNDYELTPSLVELNHIKTNKNKVQKSSAQDEFGQSVSRPASSSSQANAVIGGVGRKLFVEQKLLMLFKELELKMKSVDQAAESIKYIAEKAEAIERIQNITAKSLLDTPMNLQMNSKNLNDLSNIQNKKYNVTHNNNNSNRPRSSPSNIANNSAYNSEHGDHVLNGNHSVAPFTPNVNHEDIQNLKNDNSSSPSSQFERERDRLVSDHMNLEKLFFDIQHSLGQIYDALEAQKQTLISLQDRRSARKNAVTNWKKQFKRENERSATNEERTEAVGLEINEYYDLKAEIKALKAENIVLNSKSIAMQSELYKLNDDIELSGREFFKIYKEPISKYQPNMLLSTINEVLGESGSFDINNFNHQNNRLKFYDSEDKDPFASTSSAGSRSKHLRTSSTTDTDGDSSGLNSRPSTLALSTASRGDTSGYHHRLKKNKKHRHKKKVSTASSDDSDMNSSIASKANKKYDKKKRDKQMEELRAFEEENRKFSVDSIRTRTPFSDDDNNDRHSKTIPTISNIKNSARNKNGKTGSPGVKFADNNNNNEKSSSSQQQKKSELLKPAIVNSNNKISFVAPSKPSSTLAEKREKRAQFQKSREIITKLKGEMELKISNLEGSIEEIEMLNSDRADIHNQIKKWVENFTDVSGYEPEKMDKNRSQAFKSFVETYNGLQEELKLVFAEASKVSSQAFFVLNELTKVENESCLQLGNKEPENYSKLFKIPIVEDVKYIDPYEINLSNDQTLINYKKNISSSLSANSSIILPTNDAFNKLNTNTNTQNNTSFSSPLLSSSPFSHSPSKNTANNFPTLKSISENEYEEVPKVSLNNSMLLLTLRDENNNRVTVIDNNNYNNSIYTPPSTTTSTTYPYSRPTSVVYDNYDDADNNEYNNMNTSSVLDDENFKNDEQQTVFDIDTIRNDYSQVKKTLKKWKTDFYIMNKRKPKVEDYESVDNAGIKEKVILKSKLKQVLMKILNHKLNYNSSTTDDDNTSVELNVSSSKKNNNNNNVIKISSNLLSALDHDKKNTVSKKNDEEEVASLNVETKLNVDTQETKNDDNDNDDLKTSSSLKTDDTLTNVFSPVENIHVVNRNNSNKNEYGDTILNTLGSTVEIATSISIDEKNINNNNAAVNMVINNSNNDINKNDNKNDVIVTEDDNNSVVSKNVVVKLLDGTTTTSQKVLKIQPIVPVMSSSPKRYLRRKLQSSLVAKNYDNNNDNMSQSSSVASNKEKPLDARDQYKKIMSEIELSPPSVKIIAQNNNAIVNTSGEESDTRNSKSKNSEKRKKKHRSKSSGSNNEEIKKHESISMLENNVVAVVENNVFNNSSTTTDHDVSNNKNNVNDNDSISITSYNNKAMKKTTDEDFVVVVTEEEKKQIERNLRRNRKKFIINESKNITISNSGSTLVTIQQDEQKYNNNNNNDDNVVVENKNVVVVNNNDDNITVVETVNKNDENVDVIVDPIFSTTIKTNGEIVTSSTLQEKDELQSNKSIIDNVETKIDNGDTNDVVTSGNNLQQENKFEQLTNNESLDIKQQQQQQQSIATTTMQSLSKSEIEALKKEYVKVKKDLKAWKNNFVKEFKREPIGNDFVSLDVDIKKKILRKNELKTLLGGKD